MINLRDANDLTLKSEYDTAVGRLNGTGSNVVLGGATVASGTSKQTIISGPIVNSASTTYMQWDGTIRSPIQIIGNSVHATVARSNETLVLSYATVDSVNMLRHRAMHYDQQSSVIRPP